MPGYGIKRSNYTNLKEKLSARLWHKKVNVCRWDTVTLDKQDMEAIR